VTDHLVPSTGAAAHPMALAHREKHAYTQGEERPLGSFVALMGAYGGVVAALSAAVRASGRELPERVSWSDLTLVGVATHKLARLVAKDPVTSPLRAPFTTFDGTSGEAELAEQVRGTGPRKAIGELITCPFCLGQWVATGFVFGLVLAPRPTRLAASLFTALTGADFLQLAYAKAQNWAT
jgi:hypothetical protein